MKKSTALAATCIALSLCLTLATATLAETEGASAETEVRDAESAFAQAFANRDFERFASFVAADAVFSSASGSLVGKEAVLAEWKAYFETEVPPFSWRPERVLVVPGGTLAATTGPVLLADGRHVGAFASTWRKDDDGWRVVLDVSPPCPRPD